MLQITKGNIHHYKELKKIVDEFPHFNGLKGSIVVSETEFLGSTTWREKQLLTPVTYSNEKEVVEQQQYIFDTFRKKAIPFEERISEIEEGIVPKVIETITNYNDIQSKVFDLLNSANDEILVLTSTTNAFHRQARAGSIQQLKEIKEKNPGYQLKF